MTLIAPGRVWIELKTAGAPDDHTTTIRIGGDGSIVRTTGDETAVRRNVDPREVERLLNEIYAARFQEMPEKVGFGKRTIRLRPDGSYEETLWGALDGECTEMTVVVGDARKTVSECNAEWKALAELHARIRALAGVVESAG